MDWVFYPEPALYCPVTNQFVHLWEISLPLEALALETFSWKKAMVEFLGPACSVPWEALVLLVTKARFSHLGDKDKACLSKEIWNVTLACDLVDLVTFASCVH